MSIREKIKHLLAIANDPAASQDEREAAMMRAHKWMLKHGIEVSHDEEKRGKFKDVSITIPGVFAEDLAHMTYSVILAYGPFDMMLQNLPNTSTVNVILAGPEDQMDMIVSVVKSILQQAQDDCKKWATCLTGLPRSRQKREKRSFFLGYGSRVAERIKAIQEHQASQEDMKALVLVRDGAVRHIESKYKPNSVSRGKKVNLDSYVVGRMAGERAQIHTPVSA